jgi:GTP cyclohydrolase II
MSPGPDATSSAAQIAAARDDAAAAAASVRAVDRAVGEFRRGEPVLLLGSSAAALALPVETAGPASLARLSALCDAPPVIAVAPRRASRIGLSAGTGPTVVVPSVRLTADLARAFADPTGDPPPASAVRFARPGAPDGVEAAAVALAKAARLLAGAVVVPVGPPHGALASWARAEDVLAVRADDVFAYRVAAARALTRVSEARVPLEDAEEVRLVAFRPADGGLEHFAIVVGEPDASAPVLARMHSECFTGDLLGSLRCDCGPQLRGAISQAAAAGGGIVLYLAQEGRGIGLTNKLRAYRLQDAGADTVEANEALGFDPDERVYAPAAEMLRQLGVSRVRLMTNNPDKVGQLARWGIEVVERVPHVFPANGHNERYLRTKAERSGHLLF